MEIVIYIIGGVILIIGGMYLSHMSQSTDQNIKEIVEDLNSKGLELIEVKVPRIFDTGPFPKFEISPAPVQTRVMGVSGEKTRYRIVTYKDKKGRVYESWLKIDITAFYLVKMKWSPILGKGKFLVKLK